MSGLHLITFPPSQDSELSRFLLKHYRIGYTENPHTLFFSSLVTLVRARTILFPALYGEGRTFAGPIPIGKYFEATAPANLKLLPEGVDKKDLNADSALIRSTLAPASRLFAYYHLVGIRELLIPSISDGTPRFEKWFVRRFYRFYAFFLRLTLRLTAANAARARQTAEDIMQQMDDRLSDGRRYLLGDQLTQSDIMFAVAAAALVWPDEYGGPVPSLDVMPPAIQELAKTMRNRPSGQHALRVYREHR